MPLRVRGLLAAALAASISTAAPPRASMAAEDEFTLEEALRPYTAGMDEGQRMELQLEAARHLREIRDLPVEQWPDAISRIGRPELRDAFMVYVSRNQPRQDVSLPPEPAADPQAPPAEGGVAPAPVRGEPSVRPDPAADMRVELARRYVARWPDDNAGYSYLGGALYGARRYREASRYLHRAYEGGDRSPRTLTLYAGAALHAGDYGEANRIARQALELDRGNRDALAVYHFSKDRMPQVALPSGQAEFDEGVEGAASSGAVGTAGGPTSATPYARGADAPPATPEAEVRSREFTRDAASAMRVKDYETAIRLATQAVELNPRNAQALNYRAMARSQSRRYVDAVADASAALSLAPDSAPALQTRSWALSKLGRYAEALQDAESTLQRDPANAFAHQNRAFALAGLRDRAGALEALRRAAQADPRFAVRYERAAQLPEDADLTLLFEDGGASAAPAPARRGGRYARMAVLTAAGGLLIALGILHVASSSWRERVRLTVRRVVGSGPTLATSADAGPTGAFWTQYRLIKEIGVGGMGVVYEATDRSLERRVAVKRMREEVRADPQDRRRFVNEAKTVAQLRHPSIVDIYAIVEDGAEVYLVFEYVEGRTLLDELRAGGPMDLPRAAGVLREMAAAVSHAHARGVIHRDLKPSNVMLTPDGRVKVMDFGVARQAKDAATRYTNTVVGTPPYMAPEQEQGAVRRESDVYALGICLYEMTTGRLPFTGSGAAMLLDKLNAKMIPPSRRVPGLPPGLDEVVARALAPDPDKRFRTPEELVAAVDALLPAARPA